MKKHYLILLLSLMWFGCQDDTVELDLDEQEMFTELTRAELDEKLKLTLREKGDIDWRGADLNLTWNALRYSDYVLSIGYGSPGQSFSDEDDHSTLQQRQTVIDIVETKEGYVSSEKTFVGYDHLNVMDMRVEKWETLQELANHPDVRYIDPVGYGLEEDQDFGVYNPVASSSGCTTAGQNINNNYVSTISPGAQVSWNYAEHNIEDAWTKATGSGVTIGLIDTGISQNQSLLNSSGINDGDSNGRFVQKYGTYIESNWWWSNNYDGPHDKCGHGTSMASVFGAPRNNNNMPVGVAYNANIVSYRATKDVVLNDYHERKGVSDALVALANRSDVKIISMSIGYPWSIGNVKDAVRYANSKGKLIIAAGGTSLDWTSWYGVIFPASMSETVAVTGVNDANNYYKCDTCHDGSKIDFTAQIQTLDNLGYGPVVLGFNNGQRRYTGGSSAATATVAGIAALVWEENPFWTKSQVVQKLKESSDFYPYKDGKLGYGNIDANAAVN